MAQPELVYNESIGELIRGILSDIRTLIREEIALARVEMREQVGYVKAAAVSLAVAVVALACGGVLLLIAAATGIADMFDWPVWAGFLLLGALLVAGGIIALTLARSRLRSVHAVPERTVSTLKENSQWIARRLSSVRK
jgi:protein-S-isoprenylcysteine O-methyltransferase Ste14